MCEPSLSPVFLTIDIKQNRLRIFKSALYQIGNPKFIQLLVNPEDMIVAVRGVDVESKEDQTHRIRMVAKNSVDISSMAFVKKLCAVVGELDPHYSYRLTGKAFPEEGLAVFSLKSIQRIEKQER